METAVQPVNVVDILGAKSEDELKTLLNPSAKYTKNYVVLDSKYRAIDDVKQDTLDHFTFYYSPGKIASEGSFQSTKALSNIVSMKIYKTVIPNVPNTSSRTKRISMVFEEFSGQSYILSTGLKAHWVLGTEDIAQSNCTNMIIENFSDGIFNFTTPINVVDKITISFGDPLNKVVWWNDRDKCTFQYGPRTYITTTQPSNLNGIASPFTFISFSNFTTAAPGVDKSTIDFINNTELVAIMMSSNVFEIVRGIDQYSPWFTGIPLDTSGLTTLPGGTLFNMFYEERRIFLPVEFQCLPESTE